MSLKIKSLSITIDIWTYIYISYNDKFIVFLSVFVCSYGYILYDLQIIIYFYSAHFIGIDTFNLLPFLENNINLIVLEKSSDIIT